MNLCEKTKQLLNNRPRKLILMNISFETGLKVPWLKKFANGEIDDPSVNRIQILYEFLTNSTLKF